MRILEQFEGFIDKFEGNVAHITLTSQLGEKFWCEYDKNIFIEKGIKERRKFKFWTVDNDTEVNFCCESIPDLVVSDARIQEINEMVESL